MRLFGRAKGGQDTRPNLPVKPATGHIYQPQWGNISIPTVSGDQLEGLPAANYCLNLISRAVATIGPPTVYDGAGNPTASPLLISRPVAGSLPFNTYQEWTRALIMHGNLTMIPVGEQFFVLPPAQTYIYLGPDGKKRFDCGDLRLTQDEVVHIAANTEAGNGGIGMGVVKQFARSVGLQLDQTAYTANTYRNNGTPPGILTVDVEELTPEQAAETSEAWITAREGRSVAVLTNKIKFDTVAWSPEDQELLEARKFSIAEMGLMMGISPTFLGASLGGSLTYETMQGARAAFLLESVGPYLQVLEEGLSDVLDGDLYCSFNADTYQRFTPAERDTHDALMISSGIQTVEEVRAARGLA